MDKGMKKLNNQIIVDKSKNDFICKCTCPNHMNYSTESHMAHVYNDTYQKCTTIARNERILNKEKDKGTVKLG